MGCALEKRHCTLKINFRGTSGVLAESARTLTLKPESLSSRSVSIANKSPT